MKALPTVDLSPKLQELNETGSRILIVDDEKRILGDERNFAGTSFVTPGMFGSYRYGSDLLDVTFDPTRTEQFASYGFDDDGLKAERQFIIRATSPKPRSDPSILTSKRPHVAPFARASAMTVNAAVGRQVSACRNRNASPRAIAAPAFICRPRPRSADMIRSASPTARRCVSSMLPPSTTMISAPVRRKS
jgi:hypothetical protein